ncbi:anti-sigma factor family protein [Planococcus sp. CAU13]|uniref:anti-sigma factor family protein n=1 Tax=Planococcus sp. CAU13 TaxID=1541197 RepID=UPI000530044D|nr:anti-sigma factor [Planococcus sp. CAU13]
MKTCPDYIVQYMNDYLDGDLEPSKERVLKENLATCEDCQKMYHELTKTIALVQSASHIEAPKGFVEATMSKLPKQKQRTGAKRWLRQHPLLSAAAIFVVMMSALLFSDFNNDQQFSFTKQPNVVVEGNTVIVPEGEVVTGDITVRNGDLRVDGELHGDVTLVNGQYMASSGVITGEVEEIDQIFDWLWYTIKGVFKDAASIFSNESAKISE